MLFAIPIPLLAISCSPNYEYEYIQSSFGFFSLKEKFDFRNPKHEAAKELYLGNCDNPQLNVSISWSHINEFTIIDSANKWDYFFENHYFMINQTKYKYWDSGFASSQEIEEIKKDTMKNFLKQKLL